jgi:uncharacterized protein (TIGR03086 family)
MFDLAPAARELERLLHGVADDRLTDPTPCTESSVGALLDHLMGLSLAFTWGARKTAPAGDAPAPGISRAENLDPEWRTTLPQRLGDLVEAWRDPKAWEGETEVGGLRMPAAQTAVVALDEIVMHGWDLARATGQPFTCDPASTTVILTFLEMAVAQDAPREGLFGPVVAVPEDAPAFDRALGLAGRDPAWKP